MDKIILLKDQIQEFVFANRYPADPQTKFQSRDSDSRYEHRQNLPALALPGGDVGELTVLLSTANDYGFELDFKKANKILCELIGGAKNFSIIKDYINQLASLSEIYKLGEDQIDLLKKEIELNIKKGAKETNLSGKNKEGAVLQIKGNFGVYPHLSSQTEKGNLNCDVYIFHESLISERHKMIAAKLVEENAVKLFPGCNAEYLYEALTETTDLHLYETLKRVAPGLPIYLVKFFEDGMFEAQEMGRV